MGRRLWDIDFHPIFTCLFHPMRPTRTSTAQDLRSSLSCTWPFYLASLTPTSAAESVELDVSNRESCIGLLEQMFDPVRTSKVR